ncbi:MAG: hypothetical protein RIQ82_1482, partial [Bacteroidota bacterium]
MMTHSFAQYSKKICLAIAVAIVIVSCSGNDDSVPDVNVS